MEHEKVNAILCNSDIFINTSKWEGGPPVTFIQAWLTNVLVISLNVNPDNLLTKHQVGILSGSFNKTVDDLNEIIVNKEKRNNITNNAKKFCLKNYSMKNIDKIENLFKQ